MGAKRSYSGGGGAVGAAIRDELDDWLASLPGASPSGDSQDTPAGGANVPRSVRVLPLIKPTAVLATIGLFRSSKGGGADGPGGGGGRVGGAGAQRSVATSAGAAGRGAAAALAYRTGDADTLRELGLDYAELLANPDLVDVANRIAPNSLRGPAAWHDRRRRTPDRRRRSRRLGDRGWNARHAANTSGDRSRSSGAGSRLGLFVETASKFNAAGLTRHERIEKETEIRAVCEEYAAQVELSATGATPQQFTAAITEALEALRAIYDSTTDQS